MLKLATSFSGIGAIEESLKQLEIDYEIIFASDNGERKLEPRVLDLIDASKIILSHEDQKLLIDNLLNYYFKDLPKDLEIYYENNIETLLGDDQFKNLEVVIYYDKKVFNWTENKFELTISILQNILKFLNSNDLNKLIKHLYSLNKKENFVKKSYFANYKIEENRWFEDVRFIRGFDFKDKIDLFVGGSPCQSFSTFGKKMGLEDTRGTLFYDFARIIDESKPKSFIYENVRGLMTHDKKRTWATIIDVFESLGYKLHTKVLNAADFGLPQLRTRIFIVGLRMDLTSTKEFTFPDPVPLKTKSTDYLDTVVANKYYLGENGFKWMLDVKKNGRRSRVNQDIIGCQTAYQQDNWIGDFRIEPAQERHYNDPRIYVGDYLGIPSVARKLTPAECLRLMGFKHFNITLIDKHIYRQSGNSIAVPVLNAILKNLLPLIKS